MKNIWNKKTIEEAVKNSTNIQQCLLYLKIDPRSSSRRTLKKKIEEFEIDTSHFLKKKYNRTYNGKTQICSNCKKEKSLSEFYVRSKNKSGVQSMCKDCVKEKYNKNRQKKALNIKLKLVKMMGGKCSECGIEATLENYVIFDFHHTDPNKKEFTISALSSSQEKIAKEIKKCIVLCANCHRLYHYKLNKNGNK